TTAQLQAAEAKVNAALAKARGDVAKVVAGRELIAIFGCAPLNHAAQMLHFGQVGRLVRAARFWHMAAVIGALVASAGFVNISGGCRFGCNDRGLKSAYVWWKEPLVVEPRPACRA
ncbi:MAG TPA: hypothetical protein VNC40_10385, partial [Gaiellaceae bacterium]|nr:hypothetical protein [Gaiellaceae bacterium]